MTNDKTVPGTGIRPNFKDGDTDSSSIMDSFMAEHRRHGQTAAKENKARLEKYLERGSIGHLLDAWTRRIFGDLDVERLLNAGESLESARNADTMPIDGGSPVHESVIASIDRHKVLMLSVESNNIGRLIINKAEGQPVKALFFLPGQYSAGNNDSAITGDAGFALFTERLGIHGLEVVGILPDQPTQSDQSQE